MNTSFNAGSFSPTRMLPVAQRNFSTNGTIAFVELQDIWQKNVIKIANQCHNVSNIRAPKYLSMANRAARKGPPYIHEK